MTIQKRRIRLSNLLIALLLAGAGFWFLQHQGLLGIGNANGITHISPTEAKQRLEQGPGILLVDVRTPEEYASGHLARSVLLPLDQVDAKASTVLKDRNAPVMLYCHSGRRSDIAANMLKAQGYTNVINVVGGISAWSQAGLPVVKD